MNSIYCENNTNGSPNSSQKSTSDARKKEKEIVI